MESKESNVNFRAEELDAIENMSLAEVREMQECVVQYEKENEASRTDLRVHSVLFVIFIVLCLITLLSIKFLAAAFAFGLATYVLIKAYQNIKNITINSTVISSIKEDLEYYGS